VAAEPQFVRFSLVGAIVLIAGAAGILAPQKTLLALMLWLPALGFGRRILSGYAPISGNDPLLLVEPLILGILLIAAAGRGAFRERTALSNSVAILTSLVLLGALN